MPWWSATTLPCYGHAVSERCLGRWPEEVSFAWLDNYSATCLKRIWKVERFSWYMSMMLHQFPDDSAFGKKMQRAEFDYIASSETASRAIAENYVGLPLD